VLLFVFDGFIANVGYLHGVCVDASAQRALHTTVSPARRHFRIACRLAALMATGRPPGDRMAVRYGSSRDH
jgi:hypothetical protein